MAQFRVIPTKTNLMKLKRDLVFAREGYDLLDQKRQILIVELMDLVDRVEDAQEGLEKKLQSAFQSLQESVLSMGRNTIWESAYGVTIESKISLNMRRIMGVNIPKIDVDIKEKSPYFSLANTSIWLDETIRQFKDLLNDLGELAEKRVSLTRIADEVRKTVRRVNALEKIAIPDYEESVKYIEDILDEDERETFAMLKLVKSRLAQKKEDK